MISQEQFYRNMLDNLHDGVYYVDRARKITFWNKGAERITGYGNEEVKGSFCFNNLLNHMDIEGRHLCLDGCPLGASMEDGVERTAEVFLHHKEGHRIPVFVQTIPIYEEEEIVGCVEIFRDNTERLETIEQMRQLENIAMTDSLTGAANRRYVETFIESKLMEFKKLGIPFGLAFMDVDDFKKVNDTYGHDIGDEILKTLSATGLNTLRKTDLIGRWGGEEFVAIIVGVDEEALGLVAEKLRLLIENSRTKTNDGLWINVTVSVGAVLARAEDNAESLIEAADKKMYISKKSGKNRVSL